ncbi:hypothetical protein CHCC14600_4677 [Bacillus licheniformis]|nr:hypothetical protein CHCC14600_4677 [Bacillus licheniformis]
MLSGFFLYDEEKGGMKHGTLFLPKLRHADDKRTFRHRKRRGGTVVTTAFTAMKTELILIQMRH